MTCDDNKAVLSIFPERQSLVWHVKSTLFFNLTFVCSHASMRNIHEQQQCKNLIINAHTKKTRNIQLPFLTHILEIESSFFFCLYLWLKMKKWKFTYKPSTQKFVLSCWCLAQTKLWHHLTNNCWWKVTYLEGKWRAQSCISCVIAWQYPLFVRAYQPFFIDNYCSFVLSI